MVSSGHMTTRHTVAADDGTRLVAYVDGVRLCDPAAVTFVLAHGWTLDHTSWQRVTDRLTRHDAGVRVVRYDQRGHGASATGPRGATITRLGDDLAAVVRQLAPSGHLVLAGHSMGGMSIMAMAGRHPELVADRVGGVALVSTAASLADADDGAFVAGAPPWLRGVAARMLPWVMRALSLVPGNGRLPAGRVAGTQALLFGDAFEHGDLADTHGVISRTRASTVGAYYLALSRHDEVEALVHLREVPTTVLVGTRDRLTPQRYAHQIAEALPGAHLEVYEGAGHMLPLECTDSVAAHLLDLVPATAGESAARRRSR